MAHQGNKLELFAHTTEPVAREAPVIPLPPPHASSSLRPILVNDVLYCRIDPSYGYTHALRFTPASLATMHIVIELAPPTAGSGSQTSRDLPRQTPASERPRRSSNDLGYDLPVSDFDGREELEITAAVALPVAVRPLLSDANTSRTTSEVPLGFDITPLSGSMDLPKAQHIMYKRYPPGAQRQQPDSSGGTAARVADQALGTRSGIQSTSPPPSHSIRHRKEKVNVRSEYLRRSKRIANRSCGRLRV
ncbi:hypothetical protein CONPUDRAFT_158915 [Coniophora puteana RWD-64-598 SS2]|uniref:Uncharacterized protein n=1 Tax=Coniophora puteana (strain RWD-64-598) TaxID=741705 RepID=A0A5M3M853_CONPW|nr:uncharacterized protein CONPUDRAFT_158915 [Coniophora puteana RWD-64-598 SS2]EIW75452.1 hypothetical protein CONPUDRAFT_158915 [Coniophora puteana RWD-64-598 SS2]